ncbi:unnamed protein product [Rotaria sp. Silwood2]|nr:unnamed protein product [Rotaria sp. Silwood2]
MYYTLINDSLLLIFSFIGMLAAFIYITILCRIHEQRTSKVRSLANLLSANSCIAGFLLNLFNFIDASIMYHADINIINENQRQPDSFCVLRGGFRSATLGALYHSLCIQAFYRLCCIVHTKHRSSRSYSFYICLIIIQWVISIGSIILFLLFKQIVYNPGGHFCQITLKNLFAFPFMYLIDYFLPLIFIIYIYIKIIIYLHHQSIIERFRRQQPIHMFRHIIYMLIILSITGIPLRVIFFLTHINHKLVPYYAQKLGMIFVTFSHASVMTYTLLLTTDVRRTFLRSLRVPYQMTTQIEHILPIEIYLPRLNIIH